MSVQENLSFTKRLFQTNIEGQAGIINPIFSVPIGNAKETGQTGFLPNEKNWNINRILKIVVDLYASGDFSPAKAI